MASAVDIVLFSLFSFMGNCGVALTGFGMAIIYLFFWQIAVLAGYESDFKYAVFIQSLALLFAQPLLIYKAQIKKHASLKLLLYFIPITIISTVLGQYTGSLISTYAVELIAGFLVMFVAVFEVFQRRNMFLDWARLLLRKVTCGKCFAEKKEGKENEDEAAYDQGKKMEADEQNDSAQENEDVEKGGADENVESETTKEQEETVDVKDQNQQEGDSNKEEKDMTEPFKFSTIFFTLFAGFASGYLGGLCGIRGPPLILYFLHLPYPIVLDKNQQRATGAAITVTNVSVRVIYYIVNTLAFDKDAYFEAQDWGLYLSIAIFSLLGVFIGAKLFDLLSDKKDTMKGILTIFLVLCGASLLIKSFANL